MAGLFLAGGAGDGLTSWLNTAAREGQGCLQGQPVVSEGQHICWGQWNIASCISWGLGREDARWFVMKEQDRAALISSTWLGLGSLQYHSMFVQGLPIPLHSTAVFRPPVWPVVKSQRDVSSKGQKSLLKMRMDGGGDPRHKPGAMFQKKKSDPALKDKHLQG